MIFLKRNKIYLVLLFLEETVSIPKNDDFQIQMELCRVMTAHASREKAEESAENIRKQYPEGTVSVLQKTLIGV
jgi:hypothetical protein